MPFRRLQRGQMPTADEWNQLVEAIDRLMHLSAAPETGLELVRVGGAPPSLRLPPRPVEVVQADSDEPDPNSPAGVSYYDGSVIRFDTTTGTVIEREKCWLYPVEKIEGGEGAPGPPGPPGPPGGPLDIARVLGSDTALAQPCTAADVYLYPQRAASFFGASYYVLIDSEILNVSAPGLSWVVNIGRGLFGTTAAAHAAGAAAYQCAVLSSGVSGAVTSLPLNTLAPFPNADLPYYALIEVPGSGGQEVVQVTAVGGGALTVVRGQAGTSASAHSANAPVTVWVPDAGAAYVSRGWRQAVLTTYGASVPVNTDPWTDSGAAVMLVPAQDRFTALQVPLLAQGRYYALDSGQTAVGLELYQAQAYWPDNQLLVAGTPTAGLALVADPDRVGGVVPAAALLSGFGRTAPATGFPGSVVLTDSSWLVGLDTSIGAGGLIPWQFAPSAGGIVWTPGINTLDYVPVTAGGFINWFGIIPTGLYQFGAIATFSGGGDAPGSGGTYYGLQITDMNGFVLNAADVRVPIPQPPGVGIAPFAVSVCVTVNFRVTSPSTQTVAVNAITDAPTANVGPAVFWGQKLG